MKNLIAFFKKFQLFLLFAVLELAAIYLYVENYNYPQVKFISSVNTISGGILEKSNELTKFINTPQANQTLQQENEKLRREIEHLQSLLDTIHFKDTLIAEQTYQYIPAEVIYSTFSKRNNFITINRGSKDGIEEGMGVFTDKAIVGIVHSVSENYSMIKSVLSSKIYIDVKVENNGAYGLLNWDGVSPKRGSIDGISNDIPLKKWLRVVTRGSSGVFPEGLYVGKISQLKYENAKPLWNIQVWYEEDFRRLSNVYVIKNNHKKEFLRLDQSINKEEIGR